MCNKIAVVTVHRLERRPSLGTSLSDLEPCAICCVGGGLTTSNGDVPGVNTVAVGDGPSPVPEDLPLGVSILTRSPD